MTLKARTKRLLARAGIQVSRRAEQPEVTLLGLREHDFIHIFDVGANEGQFAKEMRRTFPTARIISFEPTPDAFTKLQQWCADDGNAEAIQCALGEADGEARMFLHLSHTPSSSLLETTSQSHEDFPMTRSQQEIVVPVRRLDEVVENLSSYPPEGFLLKLDVQGFEAQVLRGAPKMLERAGACIVEVCLDPLYSGQSRFADVIQLAEGGGLSYAGNLSQVYGHDGHVAYIDALFTR